MTTLVNEWKAALAVTTAALTALWGWFGWLVLLWFGCMLLDYVTGSMAAAKEGKWSSQMARKGIWHKLGSIVAVIVAAVADILLGMGTEYLPSITLEYGGLLCPMVVVWYILTELGSITENAVSLGAQVPEVLKKALKILQDENELRK